MTDKTDKLFRKIFMGLTTFAVMLAFILTMNIFFSVPLDSKVLWAGSFITYLIINLIIDVSGIYNRLFILGTGIVILSIFFTNIIHWPILPSVLAGMVIMVIIGLFYITFLH